MFKEIMPKTNFIRISESQIFISKSIMDKFLNKAEYASIFIDDENKIIGIKPNPDGAYKISKGNHSFSIKCTQVGKLVQGYYYPSWDSSLNMLVFNYVV